MAGTHSGSIASVGGADSYTFVPGSSGGATIGSCGIDNGNRYDLYIYDSHNTLLGSGLGASYCNWVSLSLTAGQAYSVKTLSVAGTGLYRSAWSVGGARVTWNVSGSIPTMGASKTFSFPTLNGGAIMLSTCGPAGATYGLALLSAGGTTLASAAAPSNCQTLSYTAGSRALFRLQETAVSGSGAWSGTITTS